MTCAPDLGRSVARALTQARRATLELVAPLDDGDIHDQFFDHMGPLVWDLGHIANFEELWLLRILDEREAANAALDELYNPFEQPRQVRGELPLLDRDEALAYLGQVRTEVQDVLARTDFDPDQPLLAAGAVHRMIAQHESQHQETMLQALGLREDLAYAPAVPPRLPPRIRRPVDDTDRVAIPAGPCQLGTDAVGDTYDNERPAHVVHVGAFALDRFPVTTRRYAAFIADAGYAQGEWWTDRGRDWLARTGHRAPQGWQPDGDGGWLLRRFGHLRPLDPTEPVEHVSFFEADAFARWAAGRLPTEAEWEKAASWDPATATARRYPWGDAAVTVVRANLGRQRYGPAPVGSFPSGASAYGVEQLAGDVYEWTSSSFAAYPGFAAFPYPEYSEVFFGGDHRVLRGSSWAMPAPFARVTYRNWDHPYRRQLMAGLRVAYDV